MPQYMLDTDTVSFALRGQGRVATRLLEHRPSELCLSSITLTELRYAAEARRSRKLHRHPYGRSCAVAAVDVRHEQYPALRARRRARDRELGLRTQ